MGDPEVAIAWNNAMRAADPEALMGAITVLSASMRAIQTVLPPAMVKGLPGKALQLAWARLHSDRQTFSEALKSLEKPVEP